MSLQPGHKLAHYEILEPIGKGGMGEVYRAKDSKLGRDVAIKVLPDEFAENEERLARFKREAKVLASLNHPGIAAIHGLEESEGTHYLVLELVPGETLAERLSRGPIPVDEAIEIAMKIAEALEEAHERGIVHRDLKPANIMQTEDGKIKVLDFGLAKVFQEETPDADSSMSPTLTRDATRVGVILGTAAYMSPEQAKGKKVDKRADIWAFGAVLYEMLTGRKAFPGDEVSESLAAVIKLEPDWSLLPPNVPRTIRTMLRRCLEKNPKRRVRDVGDLRLEIEEVLHPPPSELETEPLDSARGGSRALPAATLVLGATLAGLGVYGWMRQGPALRPTQRFAISVPETRISYPVFSPDGQTLVFAGLRGSDAQLYRREMDHLDTLPIRGTLGARNPVFSPDGEWIGFSSFTGALAVTRGTAARVILGNLKKVPSQGGTAEPIGREQGSLSGWVWLTRDTIISAGFEGGLVKYSLVESGLQPVTTFDPSTGEIDHRWPEVLPDGTAVLFTIWSGTFDTTHIAVKSFASGEQKQLLEGAAARFVATGHLVFLRNGALWAAPFDPESLDVTGPAVSVIEEPIRENNFSISSDGSLAYVPRGKSLRSQLVWVDREGRESPLPFPPAPYRQPRLAPDGNRIAVLEEAARQDIFVLDPERGTRTRLTVRGTLNRWPVWSPDGKSITYTSTVEGSSYDLYSKLADGSNEAEELLSGEFGMIPHSWSPDGSTLSFYEVNPTTGRDLWVFPRDGEPKPFLASPFDERSPIFSPDGRWMAFVSNESGRDEVYVTPYPGPAGRFPISNEGGGEPQWSADGNELFYRRGVKMLAVDIETEPSFRAGMPRLLFEGPYQLDDAGPGNPNYAVSPNGQRFLMVKPSKGAIEGRIHVVLNWFEELERLVPTN